ncbi:MAG: hypothetical protein JST43_03425 [Bacteroidetes bacterium]|nr:hypothetical protein [Bacteroidota bacterium]MBS1540223.1 hypothetical protein [Bacteroidota bacterium]
MKRLIGLVIFWGSSIGLLAQTNDSYDYNSEFNWGINKNSYGGLIGGVMFKKARRLNDKFFETYGLELMNVKNPHETRIQSLSGNFFIWGKTNYLYAIRLQYGRDRILFKKGPQQGVEVKAVFAAGPTIGLVTPYYVQISNDPNSYYTYNVPYNGQQQYTDIQGTGNLFEGLGQSKVQLGGNLKAAINFELGTTKSQVTGFEAGFLLDAYFKKVPLMSFGTGNPPVENYAIYPTVFLTIFYGSRK